MEKVYQIDIDDVLKRKLGKKYKWIPKSWIFFLKKLICQDELNHFLANEGKDKTGLDFITSVLEDFLQIKLNVIGLENLPKNKKCTFACNHPMGSIDGLAFIKIIGENYNGKVKLFLNSLLCEIPEIAKFAIPVNKFGRQNLQLQYLIQKSFDSEDQVLIFPAGICSRKRGPKIRDNKWKKAFVKKSLECKRDIVPVYFDGQNSKSYYRLARFIEFFGIKANIPMLFLVREMMKCKGKSFSIVIGEPISYRILNLFYRKYGLDHHKLAEMVQDIVYMLEKKVKSSKNVKDKSEWPQTFFIFFIEKIINIFIYRILLEVLSILKYKNAYINRLMTFNFILNRSCI